MDRLKASGFFELGDVRLEYRFVGPQPEAAPTLVLLHEGLGSAMQWGALPETLARTTECGVLAYSRQGYGASSPVPLPRPADYLEREARMVLPRVLDAAGLSHGVLIGHSDGASIAALTLAEGDARLRGGVLIAPHFFVEDITLSAIRRTRAAYERGLLKTRLHRWHADVEGAFRGWNDAWLDPARRGWTIEAALTRLTAPVTLIQGTEDAYGTRAQIAAAVGHCPAGLLTVHDMPSVGHEPHREAFADTVNLITAFVGRVLANGDDRSAPRS